MSTADETLTVEARLVDNITNVMKGISKNTVEGLKKMRAGAQNFGSSMKKVGSSLLNIKSLIAGAAMAKAFKATVGAAAKFEAQMSSVATLSQEMTDNIGQFSQEVLDLSASSGQGLDTLTTSLFDAVSAGVDAGDAMEFLGTATQLAIGGATETSVAVDGLTTIINAFSLDASQATDVSDAFFTAMKFGKTTVEELATSIGPLAPTAKAAGLQFDEMLGAVSALTKAGFGTRDAVTAMQGALVAVNSLTPEATKHIEGMGLSTKVTGEEGSQFIDILNNITEAGGGTLEGVKKLVPNIQGVKGILALTANEGKNFKDVMALMGSRAGETAKAYSKFTDTFEFKSNRVKQSFNAAFIEVGNQIMPSLNKLMDDILANMDTIKFGISIAVAGIKDIWNGLTFLFKTAANVIVGSLSGVVGAVAKLISKIPKKLLPDGWAEAAEDFANISLGVAGEAFGAIADDAQAMEKSNLHKVFTDTSSAIEKTATSVKDLTEAEKELVGITDAAAEKKKMADATQLENKKELLENIKQLEIDFQARTHEGRLSLLEAEKAELLEQAILFKQDELAITQEFDARIEEEKKEHTKELATIKEKEIADGKKATKEALANAKKERLARIAVASTWGNTASDVIGSIAQVAGAYGASAKTVKQIMLGESIISGALAIAKANASAPFPANLPAIISATATGAAQTATIASQAFYKGGLPKGMNALVNMNEQGQESILNARATANLGTNAINNLNAGGGGGNSITNEIAYSPTINIGQDSGQDVMEVLRQDKEGFAQFIKDDLVDRGYLTI